MIVFNTDTNEFVSIEIFSNGLNIASDITADSGDFKYNEEEERNEGTTDAIAWWVDMAEKMNTAAELRAEKEAEHGIDAVHKALEEAGVLDLEFNDSADAEILVLKSISLHLSL